MPVAEEMLDRHFPGEKRTPLPELERNTSLIFTYGHHFIMDGMRPVSPNFHHIGFINCKAPAALPTDLDNLMKHKDGVIYFSFGSVFKAKDMPLERRDMLVKAFGMLKQKVIWKWETEIENKPSNLFLSKWLPQQDILGHPNTRLFITHAGLNSFQEAICHKIPVVSLYTYITINFVF